MFGLMQDHPLLISSLIEHAGTFHPEAAIVSRLPGGRMHRTHWHGLRSQARQVAHALQELGIRAGDRVATLAWNSHRHLALCFGVSGCGAVLHTVNPRLFPDRIEYIINHAGDRVLFFDLGLAPLLQKLAPRLRTVEHFVALCSRDELPALDLPNLHCHDELVAAQSTQFAWPVLDERAAASLSYTSGTTGNPRGVLYSHRSTLLHTLAAMAPDRLGLQSRDHLLLMAPMFHANGWGLPYAAAMAGAGLVLPGACHSGETVHCLLRDEPVSVSAGVLTVWLMLFQHLDAHPEIDPRALALKRVLIGGSALPRAVLDRFEKAWGVEVLQTWGMVETGPLGVINRSSFAHAGPGGDDRGKARFKQGRGTWGVEMKIVDADDQPLPWDGERFGRLRVRGPWVAGGYFKDEGGAVLDAEGFLPTGDVATIDRDGYLHIVDRDKDLIKSGGEWISSAGIEEAALRHPAAAEAAVIGVSHPKWQERPLLLVVKRPGHALDRQAMLDFLVWRMAKWWLPDDVVFVDELPRTATGKVHKAQLREQYRHHLLPPE
jgi:fatty-acyl-CoA synthase